MKVALVREQFGCYDLILRGICYGAIGERVVMNRWLKRGHLGKNGQVGLRCVRCEGEVWDSGLAKIRIEDERVVAPLGHYTDLIVGADGAIAVQVLIEADLDRLQRRAAS